MKAKNEIERWLKDEKFMAFANKRAKEEFFNSENNYIDPQYEEMAEGFYEAVAHSKRCFPQGVNINKKSNNNYNKVA